MEFENGTYEITPRAEIRGNRRVKEYEARVYIDGEWWRLARCGERPGAINIYATEIRIVPYRPAQTLGGSVPYLYDGIPDYRGVLTRIPYASTTKSCKTEDEAIELVCAEYKAWCRWHATQEEPVIQTYGLCDCEAS